MVLSKKEMGALIKKARSHKSQLMDTKYTQTMLADDLGISRGYLGDIEIGRIYPNYVLLNKIAEQCGVSLSFFGEEDMEDREVAEITDVKKALDLILSQPGLMLNGEMLSDKSKLALANALQMGLAYAEQLQKKEKEDN